MEKPITVVMINKYLVYKVAISAVFIVITVILMFCCIFESSRSQIQPLRNFNYKMRDIMSSDELNDIEKVDTEGCSEVNKLYNIF